MFFLKKNRLPIGNLVSHRYGYCLVGYNPVVNHIPFIGASTIQLVPFYGSMIVRCQLPNCARISKLQVHMLYKIFSYLLTFFLLVFRS